MLVKYRTYPAFTSPFITSFDKMLEALSKGGIQDDGTLFAQEFSPAVDVAEQENSYVVNVELPGIDKDDVKITMHENLLTIEGEKKAEKEEQGKNYHRVERSYGKFQRSFNLPDNVKSDAIEAEFTNGVLTLSLPKMEKARPKQIEVKVK